MWVGRGGGELVRGRETLRSAGRRGRSVPPGGQMRSLLVSLGWAGVVVGVLPAQEPALEPELVGPGIISTDGHETFPTIDPSDGSLWFSVYQRSFDRQTIMQAPAKDDGGWQAPVAVTFPGTPGGRAPRFSPDGRRLYFTSPRPVPGYRDGDMNIWVVTRQGDGEWSQPELVDAPVSVPDGRDIHNVVIADGTIYFASSRPGGAGRSDIYRMATDGAIERLGPPINDADSQPDLYVSPDGRRMILVVTDAEGGLGGDDLYVSWWRNGAWTTPRNLGAPVNSPEYEYGPSISPDGRWLYFTSHRRGSADVYRIPVDRIAFGP